MGLSMPACWQKGQRLRRFGGPRGSEAGGLHPWVRPSVVCYGQRSTFAHEDNDIEILSDLGRTWRATRDDDLCVSC